MVANVTTRCGASDKHYAPKPLVVCLSEVKGCGGQGHRPNGDTNRRSPTLKRNFEPQDLTACYRYTSRAIAAPRI